MEAGEAFALEIIRALKIEGKTTPLPPPDPPPVSPLPTNPPPPPVPRWHCYSKRYHVKPDRIEVPVKCIRLHFSLFVCNI